MKEIIKYQAKDGKEFDNSDNCKKYESLIDEVKAIMQKLPPIPEMNGCDFENGYGYVQHTEAEFNEVKNDLLNIAERMVKHKWIEQTRNDKTVHLSWVARLIGEYGSLLPLSKAWDRLLCVDSELREWGQPYFAEHPEKAPYWNQKKLVEKSLLFQE